MSTATLKQPETPAHQEPVIPLLERVAAKLKTGWELCGSKWQNAEAEVIAMQTIKACANNQREHGDAFSWASENVFLGRATCGTNNARGLQILLDDGSLEVGGKGTGRDGRPMPPKGTAHLGPTPQVLRCTDKLLRYVDSFVS